MVLIYEIARSEFAKMILLELRYQFGIVGVPVPDAGSFVPQKLLPPGTQLGFLGGSSP